MQQHELLDAVGAQGWLQRARTLSREEVAEELAQVRVVRLVVEAQRPAVLEVGDELQREVLAQQLQFRTSQAQGSQGYSCSDAIDRVYSTSHKRNTIDTI